MKGLFDRRLFLTATLGCVAAGCSTTRWVLAEQPRQSILTIPYASLAASEARQVIVEHDALPAPVLVLERAEEQFLALELVCTHSGCAVRVQRERLVCPCHGSRFDREGAVLQGPAERPLRRFRVWREGEDLVIATSNDAT